MAAGVLEMRLAVWARLYVVGFLVVWCVGVARGGVAALGHRQVVAVIPLLMLVAGGTLGYRLFRLGVVADQDSLTVRNTSSTRRLARRDVEGFRIGSAPRSPFGTALLVLLCDDAVLALDVTAEPSRRKRSRARLQTRLEELQRWHAG